MLTYEPVPSRRRTWALLAWGTHSAVWLLLAMAYPAFLFALGEPVDVDIPVAGVTRNSLVSTFGAPRDGGRRQHRGADIFAPKGTEVRAAASGWVLHVGEDRLGGRVVRVLGEGPALYYYAHLDEWAPGLRSGQRVRAGQALGTVGNTGNARTTPAHLHFGVYPLSVFGLRAVDPVPWLKQRVAYSALSASGLASTTRLRP